MDFNLGSLAKKKQLLGAIVAAGILVAVFVPFQKAEAASADMSFPGSTTHPSTGLPVISQTNTGAPFSISLNLGPGELIEISTITLTIDGSKNFVFNSAGHRISGVPASTVSDLTITTPTPQYSYAYGFVSGYAGPTTVTFNGTLKTSHFVSGITASNHTLQVSIAGTAASNPQNVVSPVKTITVNPVATIGAGTVPPGPDPKTVTINTPSGHSITIQIPGANNGGNAVVVKKTKTDIKTEIPAIFTTATSTTGTFSLSGATYQTSGELFDIDLSGLGTPGVDFAFPIDVTIPYDDSGLTGSQEQQIRFMHWTGTAWEDVTANIPNNPNVGANTITGRLNSLSPVVAAISTSTTSGSGGGGGGSSGGGGGGVGGGRGPVVLGSQVTTYPESYFAENPLLRFQIANSAFLNVAGASITQAKVNQQVSISADFTNYQQNNQTYAFIVQVVAPEGYVTDLRWQEGTLGAGQTTDLSTSVSLEKAGVYKVQIFILDGLGHSPKILSEPVVKNLRVTE